MTVHTKGNKDQCHVSSSQVFVAKSVVVAKIWKTFGIQGSSAVKGLCKCRTQPGYIFYCDDRFQMPQTDFL